MPLNRFHCIDFACQRELLFDRLLADIYYFCRFFSCSLMQNVGTEDMSVPFRFCVLQAEILTNIPNAIVNWIGASHCLKIFLPHIAALRRCSYNFPILLNMLPCLSVRLCKINKFHQCLLAILQVFAIVFIIFTCSCICSDGHFVIPLKLLYLAGHFLNLTAPTRRRFPFFLFDGQLGSFDISFVSVPKPVTGAES